MTLSGMYQNLTGKKIMLSGMNTQVKFYKE